MSVFIFYRKAETQGKPKEERRENQVFFIALTKQL